MEYIISKHFTVTIDRVGRITLFTVIRMSDEVVGKGTLYIDPGTGFTIASEDTLEIRGSHNFLPGRGDIDVLKDKGKLTAEVYENDVNYNARVAIFKNYAKMFPFADKKNHLPKWW